MSRYIEKIEVKNLFGHYHYIVERDSSNFKNNPLMIIYGDNGSGKTTLLELMFYLTSTVDSSGHKTKIAGIKFERFSVKFQGDIEIIAQREENNYIGSYHLIVKENGAEVKKVFLEAEKDLTIRMGDNDPALLKKYYDILNYIKELQIEIHYLSDNRNFVVGVEHLKNRSYANRHQRDLERYYLSETHEESESDLEISVKTLENWIKKYVLQGSKAGDKNTNSIYIDLIKRVSSPSGKLVSEQDVLNLVHKLTEIRNDNNSYYKYGLVSKIETKEIESTLEASKQYNANLVYNVLEPYVEGLQGRLDSLKEIQEIIELFVNRINDYFSNKVIKYNLARGFSIVSKEFKDSIDLKMLSSGEKQLLLLFCNVITASDNASIFIIDEPEISLNIKWQRKLVQTLLDFSRNKNVQFIFASHSIELLTGHKESVSKLQHIGEQ